MKEQEISFDVAKLSKQKGFPQDMFNTGWYNRLGQLCGRCDINADGVEIYCSFGAYRPSSAIKVTQEEYHEAVAINYSAPRQSLLQKWLRDVHKIHVMVDCNASGWYWELFQTNGTSIASFNDCGYNPSGQWDFYEEAMDAGLLVALNNITYEKCNFF